MLHTWIYACFNEQKLYGKKGLLMKIHYLFNLLRLQYVDVWSSYDSLFHKKIGFFRHQQITKWTVRRALTIRLIAIFSKIVKGMQWKHINRKKLFDARLLTILNSYALNQHVPYSIQWNENNKHSLIQIKYMKKEGILIHLIWPFITALSQPHQHEVWMANSTVWIRIWLCNLKILSRFHPRLEKKNHRGNLHPTNRQIWFLLFVVPQQCFTHSDNHIGRQYQNECG